MRKITETISRGIDAWMSFFVNFVAVVMSILGMGFILSAVYVVGSAVITNDYSFLKSRNPYVTPVADIKPTVIDSLPDFGDNLKAYSEALDRIRNLSVNYETSSNSKDPPIANLEQRISAIEELVQLSPEQVASMAILVQKVEALETSLPKLEGSIQGQIGTLHNWMIGLFAAMVIAMLIPYVVNNLPARRERS